MKNALYLITDIEKFQPRRKKSIIFHRKYRLIGIKSTTPEDLYSRKINLEVKIQIIFFMYFKTYLMK